MTSEIDFGALDALKTGTPPIEKVMPEPIEPAKTRMMLAVDQSLSATGWVKMLGTSVIQSGMIRTDSPKKGPAETLDRAGVLFERFLELFQDHPEVNVVAHEMPPAVTPYVRRPESSYVAATALTCAAMVSGLEIQIVQNQRIKKRLVGYVKGVKKKDLKEAILKMDPSVKELKPLNEAIYDAIGVGWVASEGE